MVFTDADMEAIAEIADALVDQVISNRANGVDWLTEQQKTEVRTALDTLADGMTRYQAVLDIIESIVDDKAAADYLASKERSD